MSRPILRKLAMACCLVLAVAGCSKKVDNASVEKQVVKYVQKAYPSIKNVSADCPSDVKAKEGKKFSCKLKLDGKTTDVGIRITKVTDKGFQFTLTN